MASNRGLRSVVRRYQTLAIFGILVGSSSAFVACGSDDDVQPPPGKGGTAGTAGRGGTSGTGGSAGTAGSAGRGGTAGTAGSSGRGGTAGTSDGAMTNDSATSSLEDEEEVEE
jgi:hypothetical protein